MFDRDRASTTPAARALDWLRRNGPCGPWILGGLAAAFVIGSAPAAQASSHDVVISEVHFHPLGEDPRDEFIELYNRGPLDVDLNGWRLEGAVRFTFPAGVSLPHGGALAIGADVARLRDRGAVNVVGDFSGKLDDAGEVIELWDGSGELVTRVHYDHGGPWPSRPDGLGPSLDLLDPNGFQEEPANWAASVEVGGTPGGRGLRSSTVHAARQLVPPEELWRMFAGTQEPTAEPLGWTLPSFDDLSWSQRAGGFGYGGAGAARTQLTMRGLYTTLYLRAHFYLSPFDLEGLRTSAVTLVLRVRYNDGFIAYLDGTQIARENVAGAGVPAAFDAKAQGAHTGEARIVLDALLPILSAGAHTLSVQGVNDALSSDAFLLDAQLALEPILPAPLAETPADLVINEVWPDDAGSAGFIEVYNRGDVQLSLDGFAIVDSAGGRRPLPTGLVVPARTPLAVTESQLGLAIAPAGSTYVLVRSGAPGLADDFVDVFVDALGTRAAGPSLSYGRYPDGAEGNGFALDAATPGGANVLTRMTSVVIHEIHFHPPYAPPSATCARRCSDALQWIELHNQSAAPVDLTGWSLSKAVKLDLPAALVPPGGYLIVAADRDAFLENHPGFDPQGVVGSWDGHLSHSSDEIHLNDARGNRADSVHYGDGGPVNDLDPEDGVDDGTFAGSDWPVGADGTGRSIELMHPILDNSAGAAWREGPLGGTPGMSNASFTETPPPTIDRVEQSPPLPSALDPVKITCKVSAVGAVSLVELSWRVEGSAGASAKITLRDDGLSGDGGAGDGVYGGVIPPQANGAVVGFTLRARLADGRETTAPAQPAIPPYPGSTGARFLYQVLAPGLSSSSLERCWIVLSPEDLAELQARPLESDILLPCTFIGSRRQGEWEVHYLAGLRYRGSQTREAIHKPYRVEFPAEDRYRGIRHLDLNSVKASREILAADLFWRAGVPTPAATLVQLTFEGGSELLYARKEHVDEEFVDRYFGKGSDSGNLYRAIHPENELRSGNLEYFGPDPAEYLPFYSPRSNEEDSDLSEIVELCRAFNPSETPDDVFPAALESLIDVGEWIRFFALQTLTANEDGGIHSLVGDDYFLYRVPADSDRPDVGKWLLLPWDLEETFLNSKQRLFYSQMPSVRRLLFHPRYAAQYYRELTSLRGGDFSRVEMKKRMMLLEPFGFSDTDSIDTFLAERLGFLDATIPLGISAGPGVSTISPPPALLVKAGAPWKYWKGSSEPAGGALAWTSLGYDDSAWGSGPSGIGYGGGDDATVLPDMKGAYSSVFARQVFDAAEPAALRSLELLIAYDDGFVAYLNGAEVARRNVPGVAGAPVPRDALASAAHAGGRPEAIDITSQRSKLVPGPNVLAIQIFNHELDSDGLTLLPQLGETGAADLGGGCGATIFSAGSLLRLTGRVNATLTQSVRVGGQLAAYDPVSASWTASIVLHDGANQLLVESLDGPGGAGAVVDSTQLTAVRLPRAPREVAGTLTGNVRWTAGEGPYRITGDVVVPAGSTLEIGPGVLVLGGGGAAIVVRGEIHATGSSSEPVLFRSLGCTDRWGAIVLDHTGKSPESPLHTFFRCEFEGAQTSTGRIGSISALEARVRVDSCMFREVNANGIDGLNSRLEVRGCTFERTFEGVHGENTSVSVIGCRFRRMYGNSDAMDLDADGETRSVVQECIFEDVTDDGLDLQATSCDIRDNVFRNVADKAISIEQEGSLGSCIVTGNLIHDSGTGLSVKSGAQLFEAHHDTITGCTEAITLFVKSGTGTTDGGHAEFHSLILWNNASDVRLDSHSSIQFDHSNLQNELVDGEGNISLDPRFTAPALKDYTLQSTSPCIGAGRNGTEMGAFPFDRPDRPFLRSDVNSSGNVNISDAVFLLAYLYLGDRAPGCLKAADADANGGLEVTDAIYLLNFLFLGGDAPPAPFPACGAVPASPLSCSVYAACP